VADTRSAEKKILISLETDFQKAAREAEVLAKSMREAKYAEQELKAAADPAKLAMIQKRKALDEARDSAKHMSEALRNTRQELDATAAAAHREAQAFITSYEQREEGHKSMIKGLTDIKSAYEMAARAARWLDEKLERGDKLGDLYERNKISIDEAAAATDGLITKMDLLEASGHATQAGLKMTGDQFATLAKAAALAAKTMGMDEGEALEKLIDGTSRLQPKLLKQFGVTLDLKAANKEWADSHGQPLSAMSETEKRSAALASALEQLKKNTDGLTDSTNKMDDGWQKLKNRLQDSSDEFSRGVQETTFFKAAIATLSTRITDVGIGMGIVKTDFEKARDAIKDTRLEMGYFAAQTDAAMKKIQGQVWDKEFADNLAKNEDRIKDLRDKRWKQDKADRERNAKDGAKQEHDLFYARVSSEKKWAEDLWDIDLKSREMNLRADREDRARALRDEIKFNADVQRARQAAFRADAKRRRDEAKEQEAQKRRYEQQAQAFISSAVAQIASAKSASEALTALMAAGINALSQYAIEMAAKEVAEGMTDLAGVVTAPMAPAHFAAAAAWGVIGGGLAIASNAVGSHSSPAPERKEKPVYEVQQIGSTSSSDNRLSPSQVTNINFAGFGGLVTRKDLQRFADRLNKGRAA
jgi:hypothetical protein